MRTRIEFTVPAVPVSQPRPRATMGHGGHARMHEQTHIKNATTGERRPHPIMAFKATVRQSFAAAYQGPPLTGPLRVRTVFVFPRPKGMIWKSKPMPRAYFAAGLRNDGDNLTKAVWDSLNQIAWIDDGQVVDWSGEKYIASGDEQPHVQVTIETLQPTGET